MALNDQHAMAPNPSAAPPTIHETIAADARELSAKLHAHRMKLFPPKARKNLRRFTSGEVAKLVGINDGYLRQLSLEGRGPQPDTSPSGRRSYTFEDIQSLRAYLDESGKARLLKMRDLVEAKSNLDFHYANAGLLRLWLFVHVPPTYALLAVACLGALPPCPTAAQDTDEFYRGKTITIIIPIGPGGAYDAYARLISRQPL